MTRWKRNAQEGSTDPSVPQKPIIIKGGEGETAKRRAHLFLLPLLAGSIGAVICAPLFKGEKGGANITTLLSLFVLFVALIVIIALLVSRRRSAISENLIRSPRTKNAGIVFIIVLAIVAVIGAVVVIKIRAYRAHLSAAPVLNYREEFADEPQNLDYEDTPESRIVIILTDGGFKQYVTLPSEGRWWAQRDHTPGDWVADWCEGRARPSRIHDGVTDFGSDLQYCGVVDRNNRPHIRFWLQGKGKVVFTRLDRTATLKPSADIPLEQPIVPVLTEDQATSQEPPASFPLPVPSDARGDSTERSELHFPLSGTQGLLQPVIVGWCERTSSARLKCKGYVMNNAGEAKTISLSDSTASDDRGNIMAINPGPNGFVFAGPGLDSVTDATLPPGKAAGFIAEFSDGVTRTPGKTPTVYLSLNFISADAPFPVSYVFKDIPVH